MKRPKYDKVLVTGTVEELNDYINTPGKCVVVDWRNYDEHTIQEVAGLIPRARLTCEVVDAECDIYVTYRGVRHKVGLTGTGRDRYVTLRRLNKILAGDYELRAFRHTLGDDTHCFFVGTCDWWQAMESLFPARITSVFARITPKMDFPTVERRTLGRNLP